MPLVSLEAMFNVINEQQTQIRELKERIAMLEALLQDRDTMIRARQLAEMVNEHPETTKHSLISSTEVH